MKNQKLTVEEWISKSLKELKINTKEEFEDWLIENFKVEFYNPVAEKNDYIKPKIDLDDNGTMLTY